jgi:O-antigen ligase
MSAMALKKPILGLGADNIKIYYPRYSNAVVKDPEYHMWAEASDAHNIVLQVLLESGIPGFIAFLYFWIKIIVFICKINPSDDIHSSGLQFSLITIIGIACFSPFIDNPVSGTFFFIFLAMLERKIKYVKESKID